MAAGPPSPPSAAGALASRSQTHSSLRQGWMGGAAREGQRMSSSRGQHKARNDAEKQYASRLQLASPAQGPCTACTLTPHPTAARTAPVFSRAGEHTRLLRAPLHNRHSLRVVVEGEDRAGGLAAVPHSQGAVRSACKDWGGGGTDGLVAAGLRQSAGKAGRQMREIIASPGRNVCRCAGSSRPQSNYRQQSFLRWHPSAARTPWPGQHKTCGRRRRAAAVTAALQQEWFVTGRGCGCTQCKVQCKLGCKQARWWHGAGLG